MLSQARLCLLVPNSQFLVAAADDKLLLQVVPLRQRRSCDKGCRPKYRSAMHHACRLCAGCMHQPGPDTAHVHRPSSRIARQLSRQTQQGKPRHGRTRPSAASGLSSRAPPSSPEQRGLPHAFVHLLRSTCHLAHLTLAACLQAS